MTRHLHITGRRWFQRTYGNTYFSASALLDGESVGRIDFDYGYGDHYKDAMLDHLADAGVIPARKRHANGSPEWTPDYTERTGIKVTSDVHDVARKSDL